MGKGQPREALQQCLDVLAAFPKTAVTSYVLVKADPAATDAGAVAEAQATVEYLIEQTRQRGLPLTIRLNPMYIADGTRWSQLAQDAQYEPPRLQDIVGLARFTESQGVPAYIGLSTEGLADSANSFRGRADFDRGVLKDAIRISLKPTGGAD